MYYTWCHSSAYNAAASHASPPKKVPKQALRMHAAAPGPKRWSSPAGPKNSRQQMPFPSVAKLANFMKQGPYQTCAHRPWNDGLKFNHYSPVPLPATLTLTCRHPDLRILRYVRRCRGTHGSARSPVLLKMEREPRAATLENALTATPCMRIQPHTAIRITHFHHPYHCIAAPLQSKHSCTGPGDAQGSQFQLQTP